MALRVCIVILVQILAISWPHADVYAREAIVGLDQALTADSNLFGSSVLGRAGGLYKVGPSLRVRERRDEIQYDFNYAPTYAAYFQRTELSGWNHDYIGRMTWSFSPRNQIELESRAYKHQNVSALNDSTISDPGAGELGVGTTGRYLVDMAWSHWFTERLSGRIGGRYEQWTFTSFANTPNISGQGAISGGYMILPRLRLGVSAEGTFRRFDAVSARPALASIVASGNAFARFELDESITLSGSIGPSYVRQKQDEPGPAEVRRFNAFTFGGTSFGSAFADCIPDSQGRLLLSRCPFPSDLSETANNVGAGTLGETTLASFVPGEPTTSLDSSLVTVFMSFRIEKVWQRGSASIGYNRSQDASGGVSSTSIADTALAEGIYHLARNTDLRFYARYTHRKLDAEQSTGVPLALASTETTDAPFLRPLAEAGDLILISGTNLEQRDEVVMSTTLTHWLTRHLSVRGQFLYSDFFRDPKFVSDTGQVTDPSRRRTTRFVGRLVVRFEFAPYRF